MIEAWVQAACACVRAAHEMNRWQRAASAALIVPWPPIDPANAKLVNRSVARMATLLAEWRMPKAPRGERLFFLFHGHRNGSDRREADFGAFHFRNETAVNEVVMALVASLATVLFGDLNAATFNVIDRADMVAIRADDFHVLPNISH